jgi:hypothetical protein
LPTGVVILLGRTRAARPFIVVADIGDGCARDGALDPHAIAIVDKAGRGRPAHPCQPVLRVIAVAVAGSRVDDVTRDHIPVAIVRQAIAGAWTDRPRQRMRLAGLDAGTAADRRRSIVLRHPALVGQVAKGVIPIDILTVLALIRANSRCCCRDGPQYETVLKGFINPAKVIQAMKFLVVDLVVYRPRGRFQAR